MKKLKIVLPIAMVLAIFAALTLVIHLNSDKLFVFFEETGWFLKKREIKTVVPGALDEYSVDELESDPRVSFDRSLMLINTEYMLDDSFTAQVEEYKDTDVYMDSAMISSYFELSSAVKEKFNKKLYVSSDFRDYEEQNALYLEDPLTATVPGASEHQTGLALDVYVAYFAGDGFIKSPEGRFVDSECWQYGFIVRYPSFGEDMTGIRFEPWHIRYVGKPHAEIIYNNQLTLEEYILSMEIDAWYEAEGYLICRQALSEQGTLTLPEGFKSCTVSPDNTGYYIVTVEK